MNNNNQKFIELCLKHQEKILALFQSGCLEIEAGRVIIDIRPANILQEIKLSETLLYRRTKKKRTLDRFSRASIVR